MQNSKNNPVKYSKEWYAIHGEAEGHSNPLIALANDYPIRLSKSSFMSYISCPRKYWWSNVVGFRGTETWYMTHGTEVHRTLENLYGNWKDGDELRPLFDQCWEGQEDYVPYEHEGAVDALCQLEEERLRRWGEEHFAPVEFEIKHTVRHPDYPFMLVGKIDGVHRHPDGGLVITELKTGKATKSKLSKTRKELCFYRYMLSLLGWEDAVYFYYLFPECENLDLYNELKDKKNTEVWLGDLQGMAVLEKVSTRSVSAMHKSLNQACEGILNTQWNMKWNDYFCTQWCDYAMSCEAELVGMDEDPTTTFDPNDDWE